MALTFKSLGNALGGALKKAAPLVAGVIGGPAAGAAVGGAIKLLGSGGGGGAVTTYAPPVATGASGGVWNRIDQTLGGMLPGGINPFGPGGAFGPSGGGGSCGSIEDQLLIQALMSGQLPIMAQPTMVSRPQAPCGYVLCRDPRTGQSVAILKPVAYSMGIKKRPTKSRGGLSAKDIQAARRVQSVVTDLTVARKPRMQLKSGRKK